LWRPEVVTDASGVASIPVEMADSITTWRLTASAIAADGRVGLGSAQVRVMQDFFVDVELPPALTQHDEIALPVSVWNYLPTAQRIVLRLDEGKGFERVAEPAELGTEQVIELAPSE